MKFSSLLVALTTILPSVLAQNSDNYTSGLVAALNGAGLTALAGLVGQVPSSGIQALQQGNHTIFAPSDTAVSGALASLGSANITQVLEYHIAAGVVNTTSLNSTETVVRSSLSDSPTVFLPGNQSQVLIITKENGNVILDNIGNNVTVSQNATYQNLQILVIDRVLAIPQDLASVVSSTSDLSGLAGAVQGLSDLIGNLTRTRGVTLFLPVNSAVTNAASALGQANSTEVTNVLLNHVINGTALYAPQITDGLKITGAGGEPLTFAKNSTGIFVTSGNSTAQVVHPNILTANGVVHLIDNVLLNTASNPAAASSAAASLSSSEAHNTATQTGPVTPSHTGGAISAVQIAIPFKLLCTVLAGALIGASLL